MVMQSSISRLAVTAAVIAGVAAGSYGIASAASGSRLEQLEQLRSSSAAQSQSAQRGWGGQRSDETLLTGDTASKVQAAALAKVSGGTVVRVETDADGNAALRGAHDKADGTP